MKRWTSTMAVAGALCAMTGAAILRAQEAPPDLLLSNGKIITVDERFTIAQAVAVRGDRIVAVGSNQEMALALTLCAQGPGLPGTWVFLSAGTDGRDGPTDAAGAVVDGGTISRAKLKGIDPQRALDENDSYTLLDATGDLLRTGPTGTNVADLQVLLFG